MSIEMINGKALYTIDKSHSVGKQITEADEIKPETPEKKEQNTDEIIFGTSPYAKNGYEDYLKNRMKELASTLFETAENSGETRRVSFREVGDGKKVQISEEAQQMINGVSERKAAQKAAQEALKAEQPAELNNAFVGTGTMKKQYLVFTEELYKNGFYKGLSKDEIQKVQGILQDITSGMDEINGGHLIDLSREMSHEAAKLELTSSVSALRYFSEKFVPEEMQSSFNALIDQYESYNSANVASHKNIYDMRDESMSTLPPPNAKNVSESVYKSQQETIAYQEIGKVTHTADEEKANQQNYKALFDQLVKGEADVKSIFGKIQDALINYASGNSDNSTVKEFLMARNQSALGDMQSYWSKLLDCDVKTKAPAQAVTKTDEEAENVSESEEKAEEIKAKETKADEKAEDSKDDGTDYEMGTRVGINAERRARQIASAQNRSDITAVLSMLNQDLSDCQNGLAHGWCDEAEVQKCEALLAKAQARMTEIISSQSGEESNVIEGNSAEFMLNSLL